MKKDLPQYVRLKRGANGVDYIYFERGGGRVRIKEELFSPEFWAEYARLRKGLPTAPARFNWSSLIVSYRTSERYTKLAVRTRKDYEKALEYIEKNIGSEDPRDTKRHNVIAARDAVIDTVKFSRDVVSVFSVLFEHSIDEGWRKDNPAKGVTRPRTPENKATKRKPWPDALVERFRATAPLESRARLIFELCISTGQRIGDVLEMRESDIEDGAIHVKQNKTGAELWIPMTPQLEAAIAARPPLKVQPIDPTIVMKDDGEPVDYFRAARWVRAVRNEIGAGKAHDIHALRYTTAAELGALGLSDEVIMSVTGHASVEMVRKYAGAARQKARAREAQEKRR